LTSGLSIKQSRLVDHVPSASAGHDPALVEAAQAGDRAAFGMLYERFGSMVHGVLVARVPFDEVDDLVQDVFLVALERLSSLRNPSAFAGWLAAIARNHAADYHRRPRAPAEAAPPAAAADGPRAEMLEVLAIIGGLPDAYRETLALRLVEGMTGPEIAERTGLTPASVRVNLHRGMKLLRVRLGRDGDTV
jgi:RNA polymerase sigma-70 factor (ECF subfamily)